MILLPAELANSSGLVVTERTLSVFLGLTMLWSSLFALNLASIGWNYGGNWACNAFGHLN